MTDSVRDRYHAENLLTKVKNLKLAMKLEKFRIKMMVLMRMNYLLLYKNKLNGDEYHSFHFYLTAENTQT